MANTTFLDLLKPLGTDKVKVGDLNANWDKIDTAWGGRLTGRAVTAALPVSGWSDNAQTVNVDRMTATAAVVLSPAPDSWAAYPDGTYERVLFTGSSCALPPVPVSGQIKIGLYAADIHTTRPVRTLAVHSIISSGGNERAPAPNVYDQLMEKLNGLDAENEYTQLSALIDTDTLNAVHNADGSILTDERGNIILRA